MYNADMPSSEELPSTAKLIKSTVLALVGAAILLVTVVMPAEYGIDPTGVGKALGLKSMGEIKHSLAHEAEADAQAHAQTTEQESHTHGGDSHSHGDEDKPHGNDTHSHKPEPESEQKEHHHGDGDYHKH